MHKIRRWESWSCCYVCCVGWFLLRLNSRSEDHCRCWQRQQCCFFLGRQGCLTTQMGLRIGKKGVEPVPRIVSSVSIRKNILKRLDCSIFCDGDPVQWMWTSPSDLYSFFSKMQGQEWFDLLTESREWLFWIGWWACELIWGAIKAARGVSVWTCCTYRLTLSQKKSAWSQTVRGWIQREVSVCIVDRKLSTDMIGSKGWLQMTSRWIDGGTYGNSRSVCWFQKKEESQKRFCVG